MRKKLLVFLLGSAVLVFSSFQGFGQSCSMLTHNPFTNFNGTPKPPAPASLWLNIHTKLDNSDLTSNGDFLLFTGGTISLTGVTSTPMVSNVAIPDGMIVADNTVSKPVTTFDLVANKWTTRVPPGYSTSDIFISGAIINSSTGFAVSGGKSSIVSGQFFSNKSSFKQSWFYGLSAYEPEFSYSAISGPGQVASIGGGIQAGTPIPEEHDLVAGGSGGGGSNFTGSNSSTDNFSTCQKAGCSFAGAVKSTDVTCNGAANGTVTVTLTGGTAPYTYTTPGGSIFFFNSNTLNTFNNFPPGTYPFIVTDAAGCKVDLSATISQPPVLQVSGLVVNATNNLANGSVTVNVSGGTPPYSFLWSTGAQTSAISGIGAGTYTLTVTDANGCTAALTEIVTGQVCTSLSVSATVVRGDFENSCDGEATINVTGGVGPFTYMWSDGVTTSTNTRDNLCGPPPGSGTPVSYTVVVADANGCSGSASFIIDVTSNPPSSTSTSSISTPGMTGMGNRFDGAAGTFSARAYPNPSTSLVRLQVNSPESKYAVINVIDMTGKIVVTYRLNLAAGINLKELQLPVHAHGIYNFQIRTEKEVRSVPVWVN